MAEDNKRIKMNFEFLNTYTGYCKVLVIILNLLAFISASLAANNSSHNSTYSTIFLFASMFAFWINLFLVMVYLFKVDEKFDKLSFNIFGFYYNCILCIAYLFISIMIAMLGGFYAAASFFGLFCLSIYAIDAYLYFCEINLKTPFWHRNTTTNVQSTNQTNLPESVTVDYSSTKNDLQNQKVIKNNTGNLVSS